MPELSQRTRSIIVLSMFLVGLYIMIYGITAAAILWLTPGGRRRPPDPPDPNDPEIQRQWRLAQEAEDRLIEELGLIPNPVFIQQDMLPADINFEDLPEDFFDPVPVNRPDPRGYARFDPVYIRRLRDVEDDPDPDDSDDPDDHGGDVGTPIGPDLHLAYQNGQYGTPTWEQAFREIENGRKRTHWMWYVFPTLRGVREHQMPRLILRKDQLRAYISNDTLRRRLKRIIVAAADKIWDGVAAAALFGGPPLGPLDAEKFHECVTVFFLVTAQWQHENRPEWEWLHRRCNYALDALFSPGDDRRPDVRPEERLNQTALRVFLGG